MQVAAAHAVAGDVQLARHADRHRLAMRVEHVQPHVRERTPDRHRLRAGASRAARIESAVTSNVLTPTVVSVGP